MGLEKYQKMRDFSETPEPSGEVRKKERKPLRFVIQEHHASRLHYDFRLEMEGVLKSWAVPKGPSTDPKVKRLAVMVEDHPFSYRTFAGEIPEGNYGAGIVFVWDEGTYHALGGGEAPEEDERKLLQGLEKGDLKFVLNGKKLQGAFALVRSGKDRNWLLIKKSDEYAHTPIEVATKKIVKRPESEEENSELDNLLKDAPKANFPEEVSPMLATLTDEPFDRKNWIYEVKWDGYRAVAMIRDHKADLISRNNISFNERFFPIVRTLGTLSFDAVLDGEVVVVDEAGKSDFQLLQNYQRTGQGNLVYYVFDLLHFNGKDLKGFPLRKRKEILKKILPELENVRYSEHVEENGKAFFEAARAQGLEGVMAKDGSSHYLEGVRTRDWLKVKTHLRQEAVICGVTAPRGSRKAFGALILGVYEGEELIYIGHTGTGFREKDLEYFEKFFEPYFRDTSPFQKIPKVNSPVQWMKPELVCEVQFSEWTADGSMRHPVFIGLREDKDPEKVKKELPKNPDGISKEKPKISSADPLAHSELKLTHLKKIFWPEEGFTKEDLISYYRDVSSFILPYLEGRPQTLHRFPNGIKADAFYQKDIDHEVPSFIRTEPIYSETVEKDINYLICNNAETLLYLANLGCIEINVWNSRFPKIEYPDYMVMDLDPEDIEFAAVVKTALKVHEVLERYEVPSFCKTSGATGLHIFVPLGAKYEVDAVVQFAKIIGHLVHAELPEITSMERSPKDRQKKVYLDYLQNRKHQTMVSPYCVRPKPSATVSTPLRWEEVNQELSPKQFTVKNIFQRLEKEGDLWKGVLGEGISIEEVLAQLDSAA